LVSKPQLAAFTGFHGTTSPLHRAAAAGHLSTCKAIIELIKSKIAETEQACNNGKQRSSTLKRWKSLLTTVIDQRSHRGQTPIMLACESGHADIVAFLLNEGADPLATDMFHSRTALHYAASGGHAQCIKILCSDTIFVDVEGTQRLLRDVITDDLQVHSAKYIDQRSNGGLTALHFAAVSGNLDSLQALLRAGASIMVKTSVEIFIGQEYLTAGSTPLHIAVLVGSIPLAHAILQAHAEMMTVISLGRDERRRRLWEGHSRSDIRSVRNAARKLPYHIARDKQWTQMMHLIDPRISVDAALDAARDTDHGIGPKNLATICSLVLQTSLLQWLDQTEVEIEAEKEIHGVSGENEAPQQDTSRRLAAAAAAAEAPVVVSAEEDNSAINTNTAASRQSVLDSPPQMQASSLLENAPTTPGAEEGGVIALAPTTTTTTAPLVTASAPAISAVSMGSLHTYLGMLYTRRSSPSDSDSPLQKHGEESTLEEQHPSTTTTSTSSRSSSRANHHQRSATLAYGDLSRLLPAISNQQTANPAGGVGGRSGSLTLRSRAGLPRASSTGTLLGSRSIVAPLQLAFPGESLSALQNNVNNDDSDVDGIGAVQDQPQQHGGGTMRRVFSTLREKLKSSDGSSSATDGDSAQDLTAYTVEDNTAGGGGIISSVHSQAGKGCYISLHTGTTTTTTTHCGDSSSSSAASSAADDYGYASNGVSDTECGVCLDSGVQVAFSGCEHALCLQCARNLTKQEKKPPSCPFCRRMVVGFTKVTLTPMDR
jgi:E3 ubiquitin-protein ligase XBAT32/33